MAMNVYTVYCRFHEPYLVPPSLNKFFEFVYSKNAMEAVVEVIPGMITRREMIFKNTFGG